MTPEAVMQFVALVTPFAVIGDVFIVLGLVVWATARKRRRR